MNVKGPFGDTVFLGPDTVYLSDITTTPPADALNQSPASDHTLRTDEVSDGTGFISYAKFLNVNTNTYAAVTDNTSKLDDTTAKWPVPDDMRAELQQLMGTHMAQPLLIFKDDVYVPPLAVNSTLKDSLVEVHFSIKHYRIHKRDSKPIDSFTGLVEQVIVLRAGEPRVGNSYKRKNLLEGPYRPKPFKPVLHLSGTDATIVPAVFEVAAVAAASQRAVELPLDSMAEVTILGTASYGPPLDVPHSANLPDHGDTIASTSAAMTGSDHVTQHALPPIEPEENMLVRKNEGLTPVIKGVNKSTNGNSGRKASTAGKRKA